MWQSVSDERKVMGLYVSDKQPLTICHDRVVIKSCGIVCGTRTTRWSFKIHVSNGKTH